MTTVWRRAAQALAGESQRLANAYDSAEGSGAGEALRSPPGPTERVAVSPEGLLARIDSRTSSPVSHLVPWRHVEQVSSGGPGVIVVRLERVGDVMVPSRLGREIWDRMAAHQRPGHASMPDA